MKNNVLFRAVVVFLIVFGIFLTGCSKQLSDDTAVVIPNLEDDLKDDEPIKDEEAEEEEDKTEEPTIVEVKPSIMSSSNYYDFAPGYENDFYIETYDDEGIEAYMDAFAPVVSGMKFVDSKNGSSKLIKQDNRKDFRYQQYFLFVVENHKTGNLDLYIIYHKNELYGTDVIFYSTLDEYKRSDWRFEDYDNVVFEQRIFALLFNSRLDEDERGVSYLGKSHKYQDDFLIFDIQAIRFLEKYLNSVRKGSSKPYAPPVPEHWRNLPKIKE